MTVSSDLTPDDQEAHAADPPFPTQSCIGCLVVIAIVAVIATTCGFLCDGNGGQNTRWDAQQKRIDACLNQLIRAGSVSPREGAAARIELRSIKDPDNSQRRGFIAACVRDGLISP